MNKMAGTWTAASATAATQYQFAANGRFGTTAAVQNYNLVGVNQVLTTTQAFFGDGAFALKENVITLMPDQGKGAQESGWVRLEEESRDAGRTWSPILYFLRVSAVDGKDYEVRYLRR
jgi:hypothetical protein